MELNANDQRRGILHRSTASDCDIQHKFHCKISAILAIATLSVLSYSKIDINDLPDSRILSRLNAHEQQVFKRTHKLDMRRVEAIVITLNTYL